MEVKKTPTDIERRLVDLNEVKATEIDDTTGRFTGYGAVFGNVDSYGDVIQKGAFADSLKDWKSRGKYPPMLLQHGGWGIGADDMLPVGEWLAMEENSRGLKVEGRLFAMDTERGRYIYEGLKSGALDGLSIGFEAIGVKFAEKPTDPERTLTEIKLWEVSIVTFPANSEARIMGVKNMTPEELRELEAALCDEGLSRRSARTAISGFKKWCQRDADAPVSVPRDEVTPDVAGALAAMDRLSGMFCAAAIKAR